MNTRSLTVVLAIAIASSLGMSVGSATAKTHKPHHVHKSSVVNKCIAPQPYYVWGYRGGPKNGLSRVLVTPSCTCNCG